MKGKITKKKRKPEAEIRRLRALLGHERRTRTGLNALQAVSGAAGAVASRHCDPAELAAGPVAESVTPATPAEPSEIERHVARAARAIALFPLYQQTTVPFPVGVIPHLGPSRHRDQRFTREARP